MADQGTLMPQTKEVSASRPWPSVGGLELTVAVLFIELIANAALLARIMGPGGMATVFAGFAALMYSGAICPGQFTARRASSWIGRPWHDWVGAAAAGFLVGVLMNFAMLALGHSSRVSQPFHEIVLAVTLGPIVEEICFRGLVLPILIRAIGCARAVTVTSALFAFAHWPASILKLVCIALTGAVYGSVRVRSGSVALAAISHTGYNLAILVISSAR